MYEDKDKWIPKYKNVAENFKNASHTPIEIYDGISRKKRTIIVPTIKEQIIHHMVVNVLKPIFMNGMYEHSYGSIPDRGGKRGKKTIQKWIKHDKRNIKYCLKMDIKKYFENIPHDILKEKLAKIIHDQKFLLLLYEIIDVSDKGIPLGFYTSQWFANWYLQELDHYIKEVLGVKYYIRYMDDMVIFGSNKRELHRIRQNISDYLENKLGLQMKENYQVFRFDYLRCGKHYGRPLDFMGYKFYRDKIILRKSIMLKATRKAKKISKKEKPTVYDIKQMMSYLGWLDDTDTYNMYLKRIKPYVSFQKYKRRISKYDKREAKKMKWKLTESTVKPLEIDEISSKNVIYFRRNISLDENDDGVKMYHYMEAKFDKEYWNKNRNLIENELAAIDIQQSITDLDLHNIEVEQAITELDLRLMEVEIA